MGQELLSHVVGRFRTVRADLEFHRKASVQGGVVAHSQVLATGLTPKQLKRCLSNREIVRVHEGVYRVAGAPKTEMQDLWAAALAGGPRAAVSRRSAARMWSLRNVWPGTLPEITVPTDWPLDLSEVVVHRSDNLAKPDVVKRTDGLRITSPARTLLDIGSTVGAMAAESACIDALHRGLVTYRKLVDVYARVGGKGRPGSAAMRQFLGGSPEGVAAIESELEVRLWQLIRECGLPRPVPQFWVTVEESRFRLDFAYPDHKIAIELDGKADHAGPLAMKRDRRRSALLRKDGWTLRRYGWGEVVGRPQDVAAQLLPIFGSKGSPEGPSGTEVGGGAGLGGQAA